jgi:hypothetical protein
MPAATGSGCCFAKREKTHRLAERQRPRVVPRPVGLVRLLQQLLQLGGEGGGGGPARRRHVRHGDGACGWVGARGRMRGCVVMDACTAALPLVARGGVRSTGRCVRACARVHNAGPARHAPAATSGKRDRRVAAAADCGGAASQGGLDNCRQSMPDTRRNAAHPPSADGARAHLVAPRAASHSRAHAASPPRPGPASPPMLQRTRHLVCTPNCSGSPVGARGVVAMSHAGLINSSVCPSHPQCSPIAQISLQMRFHSHHNHSPVAEPRE